MTHAPHRASRTRRFLLPFAIAFAMNHAAAQTATTPAPGSPERIAILDAARAPAQQDLGKPVRFTVHALNQAGEWAFVYADMKDAAGEPIDYAGTPYESVALQGGRSKTYVALLQRQGGAWHVLRHDTGPTDAAWLGWGDAGAPASVYALPED